MAARGSLPRGLRYVPDGGRGIHRKRAGKGWIYLRGKSAIANKAEVRRIAALAIPPAWTDVWIAPNPNCHLQAVGFDARGRKQYRYHPDFRELRDSVKFERIVEFGETLPLMRKRIEQDIRNSRVGKRTVLAAIVRILDESALRIGNCEYTRTNGSFGLTTLEDRHVDVTATRVSFRFKGKSGVKHCVELKDRRVAKIVRGCQDIPGQDLFQFVDPEGRRQRVRSQDVNAYIQEIGGDGFSAKDFRTWAGTRAAFAELRNLPPPASATEAKSTIVNVVKTVAKLLGNRPATCRKYYIHPALFAAYECGTLPTWKARKREGLSAEEAAMLQALAGNKHR